MRIRFIRLILEFNCREREREKKPLKLQFKIFYVYALKLLKQCTITLSDTWT